MNAAVSPDGLRGQRKNAAVLKADLARLRERSPFILVVVLEGKEDLPVYEAWIRRVSDNLEWEPIVAHGKGSLLEFRELVRRDQTGIKACTYFIVDHDYDGLRSADDDDDIYVIPAYSIENYLTDSRVFDSFLRTDLHIVGDPGVRAFLLDKFLELEAAFIELIKPACIRLFGARNERVGNVIIDERIGNFINITVGSVSLMPNADIYSIVSTEIPVSDEGCLRGSEFFDRRVERDWIRGKFIWFFYKKMCDIFYDDRRSIAPTLFAEQGRGLSYTPASIDFRSLAAKSALPDGFSQRINDWVAACGTREARGQV